MRFFDTITSPVLWRGIERLFIVLVTAVFGWMGHRLFLFGITEGQAKLSAEGHYYKIIFSGTAPGLFLMVVAGLALLTALWKGGTKGDTKDNKKPKRSRDDTTSVTPASIEGREAIEQGEKMAGGRRTTVTLAARDWISVGKRTRTMDTGILAHRKRGQLFSRITEIDEGQGHIEHIIQRIEEERDGRLRPEAKEKLRIADKALTSGGQLIIEIEEGAQETNLPAGALIAEIEEEGKKESLTKKIRPIFSNKP
ncbi:MAG: hypothetical protein AMJ65_16930 [Phycisphaerae bacterium SG8_4]|nr:MAG: hypothetical protein AMJ65_16930 [Phycisphaerae bacterium SG8_4]